MSIWEHIVKWFVRFVWPEIQKLIRTLVAEFARWLVRLIREVLDKSEKDRQGAAEQRIREAEQRASAAQSKEEADRERQIAEVWRKVADELREENERLSVQLQKFQEQVTQTVEAKVAQLTVDDVFALRNDSVQLTLDVTRLLPSPSGSSEQKTGWEIPNLGTHTFGSNDICTRCGASRGAAEAFGARCKL